MFCARCGGEVAAQERACPGCGAELWRSGAVRLTSPNEPARSLADIFPETATASAPPQPVHSAPAAGGLQLTSRGRVVAAAAAILLVVLLVAALLTLG